MVPNLENSSATTNPPEGGAVKEDGGQSESYIPTLHGGPRDGYE